MRQRRHLYAQVRLCVGKSKHWRASQKFLEKDVHAGVVGVKAIYGGDLHRIRPNLG